MGERVLIVDDLAENRKLLATMIRNSSDYEISMARDGSDVISMIENRDCDFPDIILLDIMMPGMDGFETAKSLKKNSETEHIPIIFITGLTDTESKLHGLKIGGADFISKPFNRAELMARIETHLKIKKMNDQLSAQNIELKELNERKNHFLNVAAHDLHHPILTIRSFAEIFLMKFEESLDDDAKRYIVTIKEKSDSMLHIVDKLLDVPAIEEGKLILNIKKHNVEKLIRDCVYYFSQLASRKEITVDFKCSEVMPEKVNIDLDKFEQVVNSLLTTAVKYSEFGSVIETELSLHDKEFLLSLKYDGRGMGRDVFGALLEEDTHGGITGSKEPGLVIVKRIVEAHKGRINLSHGQEKAAAFEIYIPL